MYEYLFQSLLVFSIAALIYCESYETSPRSRYGQQRRKIPPRGSSPQRWRPALDGFSFNNRQSRFLSLFTFVQFNNEACTAATGDNGTCLTASECTQRGGTANGPCANGYGSCCVFLASCGMTVRENGTYFVQSGYPTQYDGAGSCQITLVKPNPDICQYRLDFDQFLLMGPETENNMCNADQFIVSGGSPVPTICGTNDGNHTEEGCLQYFTGVAGQIRSFNYDPSTGLQLSNQDYSICIRTERNFCGVQYTQCPDAVNNRSQSFTLSGNSNMPVQAMVGSTGTSNNCQADYLIIPMASNVGRPATGPPNVDRICGGTLSADITLMPATVRSTVRPFRLWFHTDGVEAPNDMGNRGFCLNYVQQPCTNALL